MNVNICQVENIHIQQLNFHLLSCPDSWCDLCIVMRSRTPRFCKLQVFVVIPVWIWHQTLRKHPEQCADHQREKQHQRTLSFIFMVSLKVGVTFKCHWIFKWRSQQRSSQTFSCVTVSLSSEWNRKSLSSSFCISPGADDVRASGRGRGLSES